MSTRDRRGFLKASAAAGASLLAASAVARDSQGADGQTDPAASGVNGCCLLPGAEV